MVRKKSRQSGRLQAINPVPSGGHRFTALVRVMTAFFEVVSDDIDAYIYN